MKRRGFLKFLGIGGATAAAVPLLGKSEETIGFTHEAVRESVEYHANAFSCNQSSVEDLKGLLVDYGFMKDKNGNIPLGLDGGDLIAT